MCRFHRDFHLWSLIKAIMLLRFYIKMMSFSEPKRITHLAEFVSRFEHHHYLSIRSRLAFLGGPVLKTKKRTFNALATATHARLCVLHPQIKPLSCAKITVFSYLGADTQSE